jgi:hypothetical protein
VILYADDFIENERQTVTVQVEITDRKEPFIGIYTYGNAAFRVYDISYQKISGNVWLSSDELNDVIDFVENKQNREEIYYIDSDDSGITGFPSCDNLFWCYLPGQIIEFKGKFTDKCYIVEKTDDNVLAIFEKEMKCLYENDTYAVY